MSSKLKAVIYARVSTEMQEEKESLQHQIDRCKSYCSFKDYEIINIYTDVMSGAKDERPGFNNLQDDIHYKKFNVLIVTELSRISRRLRTILEFIELLEKSNIDFVSITQNFDTTTAIGRAMLKLTGVFAELEREQTAERVKETKRELAKQGKWLGGRPPFGYIIVNKKLEINSETEDKVRKIFELFLQGDSRTSIAKKLNLTMHIVDGVLNTPFYTGKLVYNKIVKKGKTWLRNYDSYLTSEGEHPAYIDEETYKKIELIYNSQYKQKNRENLNYVLSGLVRCYCGYGMYGSAINKYNFYVCSRGKECKKKAVQSKILEKQIFDEIMKLKNHPEIISNIKEHTLPEQDYSAEIKSYEKKIINIDKKISDLLDLFLDKKISENIFSEKNKSLAQEKECINLQIKILNDKNNYISPEIKNYELFFELLENFDDTLHIKQQKHLLSILIKEIKFINDFEFEIIYNV